MSHQGLVLDRGIGRKSRATRAAVIAAVTVLLLGAMPAVLLPSVAGAAGTGDQIYWGNESGPVRVGNLDGSGAAADVFGGATPCGVAIDAAAGKIYWASWTNNAIQVGNLDGTGSASTLISESGN